MLHRKYLCTFNKIIGHQKKVVQKTDKHKNKNHQLKSVKKEWKIFFPDTTQL